MTMRLFALSVNNSRGTVCRSGCFLSSPLFGRSKDVVTKESARTTTVSPVPGEPQPMPISQCPSVNIFFHQVPPDGRSAVGWSSWRTEISVFALGLHPPPNAAHGPLATRQRAADRLIRIVQQSLAFKYNAPSRHRVRLLARQIVIFGRLLGAGRCQYGRWTRGEVD